MSLINTMLRDLENRRAVEINRREWQREVRSLPLAPRQGFDRHLLVSVLLVLMVISVGAGWYFSGRIPLSEVSKPTTKIQVQETHALNEVIKSDLPLVNQVSVGKTDELSTHVKTRKEKREELAAARLEAKRVARAEQLAALEKRKLAEQGKDAPSIPLKVVAENQTVEKDLSKGIVKTQSPLSNREKAEQEFRRGQGLLVGGQVNEAVSAFQSALQQEASFNPARQALVRALLETNRQEEVVSQLVEGLDIQPAQFGWAMMLSRLRMEKGDIAGAARVLAKSQSYAVANADYAGFQGHIEFRLGHFASALERYRAAIALSPNEGKWWFGLAQALDADGKSTEARDAYRRAVATANLAQSLLTLAEQKLH